MDGIISPWLSSNRSMGISERAERLAEKIMVESLAYGLKKVLPTGDESAWPSRELLVSQCFNERSENQTNLSGMPQRGNGGDELRGEIPSAVETTPEYPELTEDQLRSGLARLAGDLNLESSSNGRTLQNDSNAGSTPVDSISDGQGAANAAVDKEQGSSGDCRHSHNAGTREQSPSEPTLTNIDREFFRGLSKSQGAAS